MPRALRPGGSWLSSAGPLQLCVGLAFGVCGRELADQFGQVDAARRRAAVERDRRSFGCRVEQPVAVPGEARPALADRELEPPAVELARLAVARAKHVHSFAAG